MKLAGSIPFLALACGSPAPAPLMTPTPASTPAPPAELLVYQDDGNVRFFDVTSRALTQTREVKLPLRPAKIEWTHHGDPVVLLEMPLGGGSAAQKKHDGEVGILRKDGYHAIPAIPASTWAPPGVGHDASVDLIVTATDEIWAGRCEWAAGAKSCTDWIYARVAPEPLITSKVAPTQAFKLASAPTWVGLGVELVADPSAKDPARQYLRCTIGGGATEFPPKEQRVGDYAGVTHLRWIRAQPPTYAVSASLGERELDGQTVQLFGPVWFEGCARTQPQVIFSSEGPAGFTALYAGGTIEVLHEGRLVGTVKPVGDGGAINPRWRR